MLRRDIMKWVFGIDATHEYNCYWQGPQVMCNINPWKDTEKDIEFGASLRERTHYFSNIKIHQNKT